ncbi:hypothetical protein ACE3MS_29065 [Paenibacillus dendritiformis]|uniref:hypothetical protein n=1 Tax=Paenibacillus dendritiformis TaxID=130049 RepID=UPI0036627308
MSAINVTEMKDSELRLRGTISRNLRNATDQTRDSPEAARRPCAQKTAGHSGSLRLKANSREILQPREFSTFFNHIYKLESEDRRGATGLPEPGRHLFEVHGSNNKHRPARTFFLTLVWSSTAYHASPLHEQNTIYCFFPMRIDPFVFFCMAKLLRLFTLFSIQPKHVD